MLRRGGLDGVAALAQPLVIVISVVNVVLRAMREVNLKVAELSCGNIVGPNGFLCGVEGAQPNMALLVGILIFCSIMTPIRNLTSVARLLVMIRAHRLV
ncbi:BREX system Lon protease-like protein BrxL [Sesbania bispinosa]|nr:BREX system Lon protease-like protein BrxL [Sesbania bispinosa]